MPAMRIAIVIPQAGPRLWQTRLIQRLSEAGHAIMLQTARESGMGVLDAILALESLRAGRGLASRAGVAPVSEPPGQQDLIVDLVGAATPTNTPTLSLLFDGHTALAAAARTIAGGGLPRLTLLRDGKAVETALPMVDDRVWLTASLEDVLARAIVLLEQGVRRFAASDLAGRAEDPMASASPNGLGFVYGFGIVPKLAARLWHKANYKPFHWKVGYRLVSGDGVAETATLDGAPWRELEEDGTRFYADPFPIEHEGRRYLFVEDFPHAQGKGIVSVAEADDTSVFGTPRPVLDEPFHLSYPQVFAADGQFWMIPETLGARQLILYRAEQFPDRWVRDTVLIEDCALSDATLLDHGGRLWLFASDRSAGGSPSDCLVVFHAESLRGPWVPHVQNPILIDRTSARPGGAFIVQGEKLILPLQNGTLGYGSGLGLVEVLECSTEAVRLGPVKPVEASAWPYPRIHTLNRIGRLEVIDGYARSRR